MQRTDSRTRLSATPNRIARILPTCSPSRAHRSCAAFAINLRRRRRRRSRGAARGAPWTTPLWRRGYALLGTFGFPTISNALVASRRRGRTRPRFPGDDDRHQPHRPSGRPQRGGARRVAASNGTGCSARQCRAQDFRARSARASWTIEANGPVIRDAIAIFGVNRCMFASNFPVDSLTARSPRYSRAL